MKNASMLTASLAALFLGLTGCGGHDGPALSPEDIRERAGLEAPAESAETQNARAPAILERSDSLILSTIHAETSDPAIPRYSIHAHCSGDTCTTMNSRTGETDTSSLADSELVIGDNRVIGTAHGITLTWETWETVHQERTDLTAFGAWMEHGSFALNTASVASEGTMIESRSAIVVGDLTNRPLTGGATWLGIMVGTPVAGEDRGDRLVGTAALNYDMEVGGGLDVAFSGIRNIDEGGAHPIEAVIFPDVPISSRGTFETGLAGDRIQGAFYGPGHVEAAGVFEQAGMVGAFGAKRQ